MTAEGESTLSGPRYIQQFDVEPQFWQFINGLRSDDLIVELIQNDLDANASRTSITFDSDRLICQGDGEPVSEDGWERLSYVMGAGVEVESKRSRIGVKNHGLKACFWLGDEITIRSAGRTMIQTLYRYGYDKRPSPGTLSEPVLDGSAASIGCSIEVPYRQQELQTIGGEGLTFEIRDTSCLEELFTNACDQLPSRLLGVVRPGIRDQYTLRLSHYALGSVEIHWRAKRGRSVNARNRRQLTVFSRECGIISEARCVASSAIHERACTFRVPFPAGRRHEIPDFFSKDGRSFLAEVAWLTDKRGTPKPTRGVRRYPIGYDTSSEAGLSGVGIHFSGPYVSDAERHGASNTQPFNAYIDDACKDAFVDVMSSYLLHRHGGRAMELYMANPGDAEDETLNDLVERTINRRALPLARKTSKAPRRARRLPLGPRIRSNGTLRRVVLPMFKWDQSRVAPLLSQICPRDEDQIDRAVPGPILRCLVNRMDGVRTDVITFDEEDVVERLQPKFEANYFPWDDELDWQATLGSPSAAKAYLDVLYETVQRNKLDTEEEVKENAYLADENSRARPLVAMFSAVNLPPKLGQLEDVPLLHPELQGHRLLKKNAWKLKPYKLENFLNGTQLETASLVERKLFWAWLRNNWRTVKPKKTLNRTAILPIWPSASGDLLSLDRLCEPRSARVASILGDAIARPSDELLKAGIVSRTGRGRLTVRNTPSLEEFEEYLAARIEQFPRGQRLTTDEQREFRELEKDLAILASAMPRLKEYLGDLGQDYSAALDMDGLLRDPSELTKGTGDSERLHLLNEHIINRTSGILDRIDGWQPRTAPSADQIADSLRMDGCRFEAHVPRLQEYVKQSKREGIDPVGLVDIPCIPVEGKLHAPNQIALRGTCDFWGDWKLRMPMADINVETQRLYKHIGVVGGTPDSRSSRSFFQWLASADAEVLARHADQVLRHINHDSGPRTWTAEFPQVPFIMVESDGDRVRLVTMAEATGTRSKVVIPDFEELEIAIRQHTSKRPVEIAIAASRRVRDPISDRLREFGLRTLRDYAGDAVKAAGTGNANSFPSEPEFMGILDSLRSGLKGEQLPKRLARHDFDTRESTLRRNWREHLPSIRSIWTADSVTAIYKLGRNRYEVPANGKLDKETGTLWIKSDSDARGVFFDTIAEYIFESPKRYYGSVLDQAYKMEMRERHPLEHSGGSQSQEDVEIDDATSQHDGESGPSATSASHSVPEPDPLSNIPNPDPIPEGNGGINRVSSARRANRRLQSADENIQITDLKEKQYAWHCQACLAEAEPKMLAPQLSYVELAENRRRIMDAHHCDQVNAGGARHAGNILILCRYHHGALGDAITRTEITRSLSQGTSRSLTFDTDNSVSNSIRGTVISVQPPQRQAPVSLFFTKEHAEYWLTKAKEEGLS